MRILYTVSPLIASVSLALLAGCSRGSAPPEPATSDQVIENGRFSQSLAAAKLKGSEGSETKSTLSAEGAQAKSLVFVSVQGSGGAVDIFDQRRKNKLVEQITGLNSPQGLATDAAGNLYVTTGIFTNTSNVLVYAPPYTGEPALTLDDGDNGALAVSVSSRGVVAVANYNGTLTLYAKNATEPCATLTDPTRFSQIAFDAFDSKGGLYLDGYDGSGNSNVAEVTRGCKSHKITLLTTGNTLTFARGIQIDRAGRIAILDDASPHVIYTYDPPKRKSLGEPVSTTTITGGYGTSPFALAFLASGQHFYTVYYAGEAVEYAYPAGGAPEKQIIIPGSGATPGGVAVTPPLVP